MASLRLAAMTRFIWIPVVLVVFAQGLVMRVRLITPVLAHPYSFTKKGDDYNRYHALAYNLAQGNGYSKDFAPPYRPDSFDQPAYPLLVAAVYSLTGESQRAVVVVQLLLELAILLVLWLICGELQLSRPVKVATLALGWLNPFLVIFSTLIMTEVLATFAATFTCWLLLRAANRSSYIAWVLAGVSSGFSLLVRADLLVVLLLMTLALLLYAVRYNPLKQLAKLLLIFSLSASSLLLPWSLRNLLVVGELRPLGGARDDTRLGYVKWLNTWLDDGSYIPQFWWQNPKTEPFPAGEMNEDERLAAERVYAEGGRNSPAFAELANEKIKRRPFYTLIVIPVKRLINTWRFMPYCLQCTIPGAHQFALRLFWWILTALTLPGILLVFLRSKGLTFVMLGLLLGRLSLPLISALGSENRYIIEAVPVCIIFAGVVISFIYRFITNLNKVSTLL